MDSFKQLGGDSKGLILGINYSGVHDSAIALLGSSGETLFACALERLSRVKQDGRPPDMLLKDLPWDRIEATAISTHEFPWSPADPRSVLHPTPLVEPRTDFLAHENSFYDYIGGLPGAKRFICHHLSHAASAFWASGFDEGLCLVYDGGMFNSPWFGGLYRASRSNGIEALDRFAASHYAKITSLYSIITALLGFKPNKHEGKITGLAAYGTPDDGIREILNDLFTADYPKMERVAEWLHAYSVTDPPVLAVDRIRCAELAARFRGLTRENIAATLQQMAEDHVIRILSRARELGWRSETICLAGGLFANVKINQRVREFGLRQVFIAPPMTDDGTALGAALVLASERAGFSARAAGSMFLGPCYDDREIVRALNEFSLNWRKIDDPAGYLAERLSEGAVVGIFQGRMEFGPRALGNRSILSQASDPEINVRLNGRLRRTEFMPFAPVTRMADAAECYISLNGAEHAAEFMTMTFRCTNKMQQQSPAVVHVDGTARPQLVRREIHPLIHEILDAYQRRTGIPSLINTSFNVHEEPIVCSPSDAIRGFLETGIDILYLEGGFLVEFEKNLPAALERMGVVLLNLSRSESELLSENAVLNRRAAHAEQRASEFESAANERLAELLDKDRANSELHAALRDMRTQLERAVAKIGEQDQRSIALEAANERLAESLEKERANSELHAALGDLRTQIQRAVAMIGEQGQRSIALEAAANERPAESLEKERVIHELDAALGAVRVDFENATIELLAERRRLASTEPAGAMEEEQRKIEADKRQLLGENNMLRKRVRQLEDESWIGYTKRRLGRIRRPRT